MSPRVIALRGAVAVVVLSIGVGTVLSRLRTGEPGVGPSATATAVLASPSATPTQAATNGPALIAFCGAVTRYAADGAHMLPTLSSGATTQQFNLQYQFAKSPPPTDIGDRLARGETQLLRVEGRQVAPDSGSPGALTLQDFVVSRVGQCT